jgi:predicted DsbA family dithiol-disulfide isomerase
MRAMGRREGCPYANWKTWPNTTHAGRLLLLAEKHGLADDLISILYRKCYEEGENVSLRETVARAAVEAGVPGGEAYVASDAGLLELSLALKNSKVNGKRVSAAPTFLLRVGGATADFSGAQDTEQWTSMLEQCAEIATRDR